MGGGWRQKLHVKPVNLGTWVFLFSFCNDLNDPQVHSDLKVASWVQRRYMSPPSARLSPFFCSYCLCWVPASKAPPPELLTYKIRLVSVHFSFAAAVGESDSQASL